MTKTTGIIIVIAIIVIGGLAYFYSMGGPAANNDEAAKGSVVVSIGDPSTHLEGVSEVKMSIDNVKLHSEANGWTTISNDDKAYMLLALDQSGEMKLYAKEAVKVGTYDSVRASIDSIIIVKSDGTEVQAAMPSDDVTIKSNVTVEANATSSIALNFLASDSLHATADGHYIFMPVVKMEARTSANVDVNSETDTVVSTGGTVSANTTVGMDVTGETKANFSLPVEATLKIVDGNIQVLGDANDTATMEEGATDASTEASSSLNADIEATASSTLEDVEGSVNGTVNGSANL